MNERLARIRLLAMDVDGTLTEGEMVFVDGEQIKVFNVYDGLGTRLAINAGLKIAWVTGNVARAVSDRAESLGVTDVCQGVRYKSDAIDALAARHGLEPDEIAYVGDDLNDLPAFERAGVSIAVANAVDEVKARADLVTQRGGGHGAVREVIEMILRARGEWEAAVESFLEELRREQDGKAGPEAVA